MQWEIVNTEINTVINMVSKQGAVFVVSYYGSANVVIINENMMDIR